MAMDDSGTLEVRWVQGFTNQHVSFANSRTICYPCGNFVIFKNTETKEKHILQCPSGSIGAFAVHGKSEVVAFSEQRLNPSIYVYTFPGFEKRAELKGGAKMNYSKLAFSHSGPYLASCSLLPDYNLTLWNWNEQVPLCSYSQMGVEVTILHFNPTNWHQLCTANRKMLTLWNIERSNNEYIMKPSFINIPSVEGSFTEAEHVSSYHLDSRLTYYGPKMPVSAIAGLLGEEAETFQPKEVMKKKVHPSSCCWSATSDVIVGCEEGHLLLVTSETQNVIFLFNPVDEVTSQESLQRNLIQDGSLQSLALHSNGIYAAGNDGILRCFHIKGSQIEIEECWVTEESINYIEFSPDYKTLALSTSTGTVYSYMLDQTEHIDKILDDQCGNFISAMPLFPGNSYCVSIREMGEVQVWSVQDGSRISTLPLTEKVTCLASCPISKCAVVGTASGYLCFIDLTTIEQPRVVHRLRLYESPVLLLQYENGGHFLLTGASDKRIFILDARPSKMFAVIGYIEITGIVLDFSVSYNREDNQVKVIALSALENQVSKEGTHLEIFILPAELIQDASRFVDERGAIGNNSIQKHSVETKEPVSSVVLGTDNRVFGYCNATKSIQKFVLPENLQSVILTPEQEVKGCQLGPAFLYLSPHCQLLASVAKDGFFRIQNSNSLETFSQLLCHSYHTNGISAMSFSLDCQVMFTVGSNDGALVCLQWRTDTAASDIIQEAITYSQFLMSELQITMLSENMELAALPDWHVTSASPSNLPEENEAKQEEDKVSVELFEKDDSYTSPTLGRTEDATWLSQKEDEVMKKESLQFKDAKKNLRKGIKQLRKTIQQMMHENENLPELERLDQQEFNLDVEEQERLQAEGESEVSRIRNEIEMDNLAMNYLRDAIKQEYWDSMKVKGRGIKAFHVDNVVKNFPMKQRSAASLKELEKARDQRANEIADLQVRKANTERKPKITLDKDDDENEDEGKETESSSLTGSLSNEYGISDPDLYSQFVLNTKEQKINQVILLKDVIYRIKESFNKEFDAVYKQKEQEINRVLDKNQRILEIMADLDIQDTLWEPQLSEYEKPERVFIVEDSEVKVEKFLTPEQKLKEEEKAKLEEQRRLLDKGDQARERALDDMMDGMLEVKTEDVLKIEIPRPEFASQPEDHWTEDERKQFKEYEKKVKELAEEREKYRKILEAEMKKLQGSIKDTTQAFDDTLAKLFEKKVKCEMMVYQEELKISHLVFSVLIEEELHNHETELNYLLEKTKEMKNRSAEEVKQCKEQVDAFRETYDNCVAEDKLLDRGFRKEFTDVHAHMVDQLYKLYKRRPRVQTIRTQAETNPFGDRPGSAQAVSEALSHLMSAMDELDAPENIPEDLGLPVWERFCLSRRTKVKSEQEVKRKALTLAEMQAFLHKRMEEDEQNRQAIENIVENLNVLRDVKVQFQLNLMVQILLKQGQVEVDSDSFITDYSDSVLLHRSVVEDLNGTIKTIGDQKIATMMKIKDFRKGIIIQEWEHLKMKMQMEDLNNKHRDIQMLKFSKELQEYLNERDHESHLMHQISVLEKTIAAQVKNHQKNVKNVKRIIKDIERQIKVKADDNTILDEELKEMIMVVAERQQIYDAVAVEDNIALNNKKRYQDIVQRKKLVDLAKTQAQEAAILKDKLEKLRMRTFPALVQLEH
ncbi:cilia- and flagella-associated protein 43 [Polypterus senegalus]|uniref:cilia- and flagella-associated protein 43 n=1 Tax=Polypterus senegalus TaxID=55291 RepID=UPI001963F60D|nr:cilia- and flagella-associated protein 43 [Polypterus senegalus]